MESEHPPDLPPPLVPRDVTEDLRLYVPYADGWSAQIKTDGIREYCHFKQPGQDFFHLLLPGEIFLQYGEARYCLNCAMRYAHVTEDRLYWQRGVRKNRDPIA